MRGAVVLLLLAAATPALASSPLLERVERLRAARRGADAEAASRFVAADARIWFGRVTGEGAPWSPVAGGPLAAWYRFFAAEGEPIHAEADARSVRVLKREQNDWYRLVDRPPSVYFVTWYFDERGLVTGLLVHGLPDAEKPAAKGSLGEFEDWAAREHPGLLDELLPEGEIDPAKPELWKRWLLRWREETGRLIPELAGGR